MSRWRQWPTRGEIVARVLSRTREGEGGCRIWTGAYTGHGYPQFWLGDRKQHFGWFYSLLHNRQPPPGWRVTTSCGHKGCLAHLIVRKHDANMRQRITAKCAATRMRMAIGRRRRSHLTIELVRELRLRHAAGELVAHLAREAGISRRNAARMLRDETWRDYGRALGL